MESAREISEGVVDQRLDIAKCLILLSHHHVHGGFETRPKKKRLARDVFECKTCNRQFPSFQALGGHRASHKRQRLMSASDKLNGESKLTAAAAVGKPKLHECTICGQEFAIGQALGGHMRRHRTAAVAAMDESFDSSSVVSNVPVLRKSNSRRIFGLDLNLTPLENDLEILFGRMAPKVDLFI